jgi:hypothetical protein
VTFVAKVAEGSPGDQPRGRVVVRHENSHNS